MPPKRIPTRWTSTFNAVEYHKEFLPYEKSFLDLEEDKSKLQVLLNSNYKALVFPSHFIVLRPRPLLLSMQIEKSDLCIGFLFGAILEKVGIELCSQNSLPDEFLQETFDSLTETFTSSEKQQMLNLGKASGQSAEKSFSNPFTKHQVFTQLHNFCAKLVTFTSLRCSDLARFPASVR